MRLWNHRADGRRSPGLVQFSSDSFLDDVIWCHKSELFYLRIQESKLFVSLIQPLGAAPHLLTHLIFILHVCSFFSVEH